MGKFTRELGSYYRRFRLTRTPERFVVTIFFIGRCFEVTGARDSCKLSEFSSCFCCCAVAVEEITLVLF